MIVYRAADPATRQVAFLDWLREQGLTAGNIYQLDVDGTTATVYEYDRDAEGKFYPVNGSAAKREPYTVTLSSLPPLAPYLSKQTG